VRRAGVAGVAAGVALLACAAALAKPIPPTGDGPAVLYFRQQAKAYAKVAGATVVETGYYFVHGGARGSVDYAWGSNPPGGYRPATATIHARLARGQIVAYLAELKAKGVRRLRIVMAGGTVFTSTSRCWHKAKPAASPLGTGATYLFNDGGAHFSPRAGRSVTFTYTWSPGSTATQTDVFTARKPAAVKVSVEVSGKQRMSIRQSIAPLRKAPALPVPSPPALPQPKPLCK
jgi:hypothetical protein